MGLMPTGSPQVAGLDIANFSEREASSFAPPFIM
jgi:hypothetical protein